MVQVVSCKLKKLFGKAHFAPPHFILCCKANIPDRHRWNCQGQMGYIWLMHMYCRAVCHGPDSLASLCLGACWHVWIRGASEIGVKLPSCFVISCTSVWRWLRSRRFTFVCVSMLVCCLFSIWELAGQRFPCRWSIPCVWEWNLFISTQGAIAVLSVGECSWWIWHAQF